MAAQDPATKVFYAERWSAVVEVEKEIGSSPQLDGFLGDMPEGARILELGCGGGRDSKAILAAGFDLDATDGCAELVAMAATHIGLPVRLMQFAELDAVEEYQGVWASACLLHVFRDDLGEIIGRIHQALKPGGKFFTSYKAGQEEGRDEYGRYFNYPDPKWLSAAYHEAVDWESFTLETGPGLQHGGSVTEWHRVTVMRKGEG